MGKSVSSFLKKKRFDLFLLFIIFLISVTVFVISQNIIENKVETIENEKYNIYSQKMKDQIKVLIDEKKNLTFSIALALSQNESIKKALNENNIKYLRLEMFSKVLAERTPLKNSWFQIIDKNGISFYRSWVKKRDDNIARSRLDIQKLINDPQKVNSISTGTFDMTFKSMVPIYDDEKFIGIFECITHFDSIVNRLRENKIAAVVLVDKSYKSQLTRALSKTFINDYYVSNSNADPKLTDYIKKNGAEKYFNTPSGYILDKDRNFLITTYVIPDLHGKAMGSIVAFKNIDSINMKDIDHIKTNMTFYTVSIVLFLFLTAYYMINRKHTEELDNKVNLRTQELNREKQYIQNILNINPSIILVSKNSSLISANQRFFEFFECESLEDFKKRYNCICDFFISIDDEEFTLKSKKIKDQIWSEYLAENLENNHTVKLKFKDKTDYFAISALYLNDKDEILLTMQNITELKNKDNLLFEQSKLASMGEMIGNIAHQWRQPLSNISTIATAVQLKIDMDQFEKDEIYKFCGQVYENACYLSNTIDDFRDFIKGEREKKEFDIPHLIDSLLNLMTPSIKNHFIDVVTLIEDNLQINGYESELMQCLLNILNNSKDALKNKDDSERFIFIEVKKYGDQLKIVLKDNGGGIPDKIRNRIFEPYFTTKHQYQGTGLGLHMAYNIIVNGMNGTIEADNEQFGFNNKKYTGAKFTITLPLNIPDTDNLHR